MQYLLLTKTGVQHSLRSGFYLPAFLITNSTPHFSSSFTIFTISLERFFRSWSSPTLHSSCNTLCSLFSGSIAAERKFPTRYPNLSIVSSDIPIASPIWTALESVFFHLSQSLKFSTLFSSILFPPNDIQMMNALYLVFRDSIKIYLYRELEHARKSAPAIKDASLFYMRFSVLFHGNEFVNVIPDKLQRTSPIICRTHIDIHDRGNILNAFLAGDRKQLVVLSGKSTPPL
jgi:hypothetical protein